jgi:hypothetical protein
MKFFQIFIITSLFTALSFYSSVSIAQYKNATAPVRDLRATQNQYGLDPNSTLLSRVTTTPDDIIKEFKGIGALPTEHQLTREEVQIVSKAFAALPPLHQRVLNQHLKSISFLDNMPNTAFTSPITRKQGINLYHIAFRSGILHQTISQWVTEKERTCFAGGDSSISVSIQAGMLSALTYVMLHESTHVLDGSLQLISTNAIAGKPQLNEFTAGFSKGIWKNINALDWPFKDSAVVRSRFRGGHPFKSDEADRVYNGLSQTPFVSLYGTASWHEDLAELLTVYHLNQILRQPFRLVITKNGNEVFSYEPMKSAVVKGRIKFLKYFYTKL